MSQCIKSGVSPVAATQVGFGLGVGVTHICKYTLLMDTLHLC